MGLTVNVQGFINKHQLFDESNHIILGLSGGADSMALAHFLLINGYQFTAAHCNFHLRGQDSDLDQQLVQKWCNDNQVKLKIKDFNTLEYAHHNKVSIEMAARDLRYSWFEKLTKELNAQVIAVAHHVNDQIETFFLNMLRGSGIRGYKGMLPAFEKIVRPFLNTPRAEIEDYINKYQIPYRDDHSNKDTTILRNAIRHKVIPELEQINQSFVDTMSKNMQRLIGVWSFLKLHFNEMEERMIEQSREITKIKLPDEKQSHIYLDFLNYYFTQHNYSFPMTEVEDIIEGQVGKLLAHNGFVLTKERGFLSISKLVDATKFNSNVDKIPCSIKWGRYEFYFKYVKPQGKNSIPIIPDKVWLKIGDKDLPLKLRVWEPGDAMNPFGMTGTKKIKNMLTDAQVPSIQRKNYPVLAVKNDIAWLPGIRPSRKYIVSGNEEQVLEIRVLYKEN